MQKIQLNDQISIAMRKITSNSLNAGMLSSNFKATVQQFIAQDKAYSFMSSVKGTPAYWKKKLFEVLAMVKQLGIPTFFMTLSCADLRWNELIEIIAKLNSLNLTEDDIKYMCYQDRGDTLNKNPVLAARHFQYRVEVFFKEIVLNGPLGKSKYYAIRVEFQVRGSPHIHSFIWILIAPKLNKESKEEYIQWVDSIRADIPDPIKEKQLFELVKTFKLHRHSKTCRKYRNEKCRFHFGRFFSNRTIVAEPPLDNMPEEIKMQVLRNRNDLLSKVKSYIDTKLNPSKKNFYDSSRSDHENVKSIDEILASLEISRVEYEAALSISEDKDFQLYLRRSLNACFVNNYFSDDLLA